MAYFKFLMFKNYVSMAYFSIFNFSVWRILVLCHVMAFYGAPWRSMAFYGVLWRSMAFHGVPWRSMAFHGVPWRSMAFHGVF